MKKIIALMTTLLLGASFVFAEPKSAGITDSDVKAFAKNFSKIAVEMEKVPDNEAGYVQAEAILGKYGFSGSNKAEKFLVIGKCMAPVLMEHEMNKDPEAAKMMKAMGMDPAAQFKKNINGKDYAVVLANAKLLTKIADEIEAGEKAEKKKNAAKKRQNFSEFDKSAMSFFGMDSENDDDVEAMDMIKGMGVFGNGESVYNQLKAEEAAGREAEAKRKTEQNRLNKMTEKISDKSMRKNTSDVELLLKTYAPKKAQKKFTPDTYSGNDLYNREGHNFTVGNFKVQDSGDVLIFSKNDEEIVRYSITKLTIYGNYDEDVNGEEYIFYTKEAGPFHMYYNRNGDGQDAFAHASFGVLDGEIYSYF